MDFYTIITVVALLLLIILLTLFGVYFRQINERPFPETQALCPKNWKHINGNCINPTVGSTNYLSYIPTTTPGYLSAGNGFNANDLQWENYLGAKNAICGKQKWANTNKLSWDGVSNYNSC
jgi:hypothetical protein